VADAVEFEESNKVFVAPGCNDLPAHVAEGCEDHPEVKAEIITCWELSGEELAEVLQTKRIWLFVRGTDQPPVIVTGRDPFEKNFKEDEDADPKDPNP